MNSSEAGFRYFDDQVSFQSIEAASMRELYAPLCGSGADGLKSSITPYLSGDIKRDKNTYVTKPVSRQDLRLPLRNFFVLTEQGEIFSLLDRESATSACVQIGPLWHKLVNHCERLGLEYEVLSFIPVSAGDVEIMRVRVKNCSRESVEIIPTGCVPLFARGLSNKHDHEHVTSLLHRIRQTPEGVIVSPTMLFNEHAHHEIDERYFVFGCEADGSLPEGSFPTVQSFLGDKSTYEHPAAVFDNQRPETLTPVDLDGKEAAGALRFRPARIEPNNAREYILIIGLADSPDKARERFRMFDSGEKVSQAFEETSAFWSKKSSAIVVSTADPEFDSWMRWVCLQPVLRRIFGCSFLPDHDYGKGGKGWRDLWQDLLSLILIDPDSIRGTLIQNFAGVRIDGTNATIIGTAPGEFIADRNAMTRVWMDHGAWPVLTVLLYVDQTGDFDILLERVGYFRDAQLSHSFKYDEQWTQQDGNYLCGAHGDAYQGSVLEHMLVQTLTQFFNVGEHNIIRLEHADWNDGLDMAFERGESVAFSSFYAGNLLALADLLKSIQKHLKRETVTVCEELLILLDSLSDMSCDYDDAESKRRRLFDCYCAAVEPRLSGKTVEIKIFDLAADLTCKAQWMFQKIRSQEKMIVAVEGRQYTWFNGYYDNQGERVEGVKDGHVRMTLTGQVFAVMSGLAGEDEVGDVVKSVDAFLRDPVHHGHRLNTDFGLRNYLSLGRAFSFAYGTKENGSVFSHMAVMYAYALYKRGFVKQGFEALHALYRMAADFNSSKIYPNLPEYFDAAGRGMYSYLTGSASWYVLTMLTQSFGVCGYQGDLIIRPKLVRQQFDGQGRAAISSMFAGCRIDVEYQNPGRLDYGEYTIDKILINGQEIEISHLSDEGICLKRALIEASKDTVKITAILTRKSSQG